MFSALRALLCLTLAWACADAAQAARLALVIGNSAYADSPLKNPVNDARAMDAKLRQLGFLVTRVENLRRGQIGRTLSGFATSIRPGDEVVVFYAGHGLQVKGVNYLPAVDAEISTEDDVPLNSLNLSALLDRLDEAKAGVKLLFLDACRNNPFARSFRSGSRGLARVADAPSGTLMHFATRPGSVAADGQGANGLYTAELIKLIDQPGVAVEQLLKRVAANVERVSQGQQEPWVEGSLKGDFYFRPGGASPVASVVAEPAQPGLDLDDLQRQAQAQAERERREAEALTRMQADFDKVAAFSGAPALQAQAWERFLAAWPEAQTPGEAGRQLRAQALQRLTQGRAAVSDVPAGPSAVITGRVQSDTFTVKGVSFKMVTIPAGSFLMGSPEGEPDRHSNEGPQRRVSVKAYQLGQTEVTQGLWQAVMGSKPSHFKACGASCPVVQVSWEDAQAFIRKLNEQTGHQFRLPSEAEWEYAARAGTTTAFSTGSTITIEQANFDGTRTYNGSAKGVYRGKTMPVGSFPANAFGLQDMHGNVWEWVQDCYAVSYIGAATDGSAVNPSECSRRVSRGGAWGSYPQWLRSANRVGYAPDARYDDTGFRLARTVF